MAGRLKTITALLFVLCLGTAQAAFTPLRTDVTGDRPEVVLLSQNDREVRLEIRLPGLELTEGLLDGKRWDRVEIPGGGYELDLGAPETPHFTKLLIIPATAAVHATFEALETSTIPNILLMPAQGKEPEDLRLQNDPEKGTISEAVKYDLGRYARNELYPTQRVSVGEPAIMRGLRVVTLRTNPVQYNPMTRELVVTTKFRVTVNFEGQDLRNTPKRSVSMSESWANMVRAGSFNFDENSVDEIASASYLILAQSGLSSNIDLNNFVEWKKRKGHSVTVQYFSVGASNSTIKALIQTAYNSWPEPPEYVLLFGDVHGSWTLPGWPAPYDPSYTIDHPYSQLDGSDILADVAVGRLPVDNATKATLLVAKVLQYERNPYITNQNWYHQGVVTGGSGSGFSVVQVGRMIKNRMILANYTRVDTAWYTMTGVSIPNTISNAVNNGTAYAHYRGYWGASGFTTGTIDGLSNGPKMPFATFITCGTGGWSTSSESIMEHWVSVGTIATLKGAIASVGTATLHTNTRSNNVISDGLYAAIFDCGITQPGTSLNYGKLQLYNTYQQNDATNCNWFTNWNALCGDPGLELYSHAIQFMNCTVPDQITYGQNYLPLTVNRQVGGPLEGATVCLYKGSELQSVGLTNSVGQITLPLSVTTPGNVKVTITKHDYSPIVDSLNVIQEAVSVGYQSNSVDDDNLGGTVGDNDHIVNPGEIVDIALTFKNFGTTTTATGVTALASESDPYATISSVSQTFPDMAPGAIGSGSSPLRLTVTSGCPLGHNVLVTFSVASNQGNWSTSLSIPVATFNAAIQSAQAQGSDTLLSPGETADLVLNIRNLGDKTATNLTATLSSQDPLVVVNDGAAAFGTVNLGAAANCSANPFNLTASPLAAPGHYAALKVTFSANGATQADTTILLMLGNKSQSDPQGPDDYGYYCFDNTDVNYTQSPTYNWVEIDPAYGGSGTLVPIVDTGENHDSSYVVNLPFSFRFYGQSTNQITVCSNGWISTTADVSYNDFRNYPIPSSPGPLGLIAPFWDDMKTTTTGHVYTWHDASNHRFIVEWSRMPYLWSPAPLETFEVILLDPAFYSTPTGDGEIIFQYNTITEVYGPGDDNPYSTIGIQNQNHLDGIEVVYWNTYDDPAAAHVQNNRAYRFTTAFTYSPPGSSLDVTLTPVNPPIVIPASGGSFSYNATVVNNGGSPSTFSAWIMQYTPGGTWQGPMLGPINLTLPAGVTVTRLRTQNVPGSASPGLYTYRGYVGLYSTVKWDSSSFTYTKSVVGDGQAMSDWANYGESFAPYENLLTFKAPAPASYRLDQCRPNPFNPSTAISYQLSALSHVSLKVYDTAGRLVSTLVNGWQEAGTHQATFDGSRLSSGLYFVRMQAGGYSAVQKMMLVK